MGYISIYFQQMAFRPQKSLLCPDILPLPRLSSPSGTHTPPQQAILRKHIFQPYKFELSSFFRVLYQHFILPTIIQHSFPQCEKRPPSGGLFDRLSKLPFTDKQPANGSFFVKRKKLYDFDALPLRAKRNRAKM